MDAELKMGWGEGKAKIVGNAFKFSRMSGVIDITVPLEAISTVSVEKDPHHTVYSVVNIVGNGTTLARIPDVQPQKAKMLQGWLLKQLPNTEPPKPTPE